MKSRYLKWPTTNQALARWKKVSKKNPISAYNNALWTVMRDNNKLPLDREREKKYLLACLPYGPKNPAIYYNAACIYFELGKLEKVFGSIRLAIEHGYDKVEQMKTEPLFAPIRKDPRFKQAFAGSKSMSQGKKTIIYQETI